jgi:hypothetical protein
MTTNGDSTTIVVNPVALPQPQPNFYANSVPQAYPQAGAPAPQSMYPQQHFQQQQQQPYSQAPQAQQWR